MLPRTTAVFLNQRQAHGHHRSFTWLTGDRKRSLVLGYDGSADSEAQSRSPMFAITAGIRAVESLSKVREMFR
jgi:hypothetical protein